MKRARWKHAAFVLPWVIGIGVFTLYPFAASIWYSFTDFSVLAPAVSVGTANYAEMAGDAKFWKTLGNTCLYAALAIPAGLIVSLGLALVMNAVKRGQVIYSVIFYLPHLVPAVASAILWMWIFNAEFGLLNNALRPLFDGANAVRAWLDPAIAGDAKLLWAPPAWLSSTTWALPALVIMAMWGVGQTAFIYLAKLQDVPVELYEAADIDGASTWQKIRHITIPTISPIIFFNVIMGIIGAFQVFTEPFLMTQGGPAEATYFLPHYIYDSAFRYLRMGYASAMSWILFLIILGLTALAFRLSRDRVHYAGR
ncbi:MAG: sugar ABC transporter permease [Planctomycetes bacterium]|nr:sugar ABC transporter permease [Planctomycetota bacterium]